MAKLEPLWNKKALSFSDTLIIADLHVGYERELEDRGVNLPSQSDIMMREIYDMLESEDHERLVINGDLKHNIPSGSWQEYKEIPEMIDRWLEVVEEVYMIPGNHDGGIQSYLPREVRIKDSSGYVLEDIGILHGHANPSEEVLDCETIIIAHSHPTISLIDSLGRKDKMQCWIKMEFEIDEYKGEIILMPHFNHLMGGNSINENGYLGPLLNNSTLKDQRLYLLDGTYLGKLECLANAQRDIDKRSFSYIE